MNLTKCIAFHNGSNYDYYFIIRKFAKGENVEKYITLIVPIKKEVTRNDENGEEITENISYILQFIDTPRFMSRSLKNLVNNLSEGIRKIKCKYGYNDQKWLFSWIHKL